MPCLLSFIATTHRSGQVSEPIAAFAASRTPDWVVSSIGNYTILVRNSQEFALISPTKSTRMKKQFGDSLTAP
jgi:hypothetical protein